MVLGRSHDGAVGSCQLALLQNLTGFGLEGGGRNGAPSAGRDGPSPSSQGMVPLLANFGICSRGYRDKTQLGVS